MLLVQHGVEPTNNRVERPLRYGVQWRKRSIGTASAQGNVALKETCRLHARSTSQVLVDAVVGFFTHQQPDLTWLV